MTSTPLRRPAALAIVPCTSNSSAYPLNFAKTAISMSLLLVTASLALSVHAQGMPAPDMAIDARPLAEAATTTAVAQQEADTPAANHTNIQLYTSTQQLSDGLRNWQEIGVRGSRVIGAHVLQGEFATMRRFGESGNFIGIGDTYTFNPDWFGSLSVGAGDGASYLPTARVDGFINRKLLPDRNLIATLGAGYYRAPNGYNDRSASLGATYYFSEPWIVQGEVRFNNSRPGSVSTRQQFVAVTWGRDQQTQITARHAWGDEGYQAIGAGASLVNFKSKQTSLSVRHWVGEDWGVVAGVEKYRNPTYDRQGATLALFWELP